MEHQDYQGWPTKAQAARIIGCSTKTVEKLARDGKLEKSMLPQPGGSPIAVYNPGDVARVSQERNPPARPAFVMPASSEDSEESEANPPAASQPFSTPSQPFPTPPQPFSTPPQLALVPAASSPQSLVAAAEALFQRLAAPPEPKMYLTIAEAAAASGVSERLLGRLCRKRVLGFRDCQAWKIARADLGRIPELVDKESRIYQPPRPSRFERDLQRSELAAVKGGA